VDLPLFYAPPDRWTDQSIALPAEEARHAHKVLRLRRGAVVIVIDGLGRACRAELGTVSTRGASAKPLSEIRAFGEPRVKLTLACGLSTGSKFDSVVQRGTELGVSRFVPLLTDKSKVSIDEPRRARTRTNRLWKVALAAAKQSRRSMVPEIALPTSFTDFLAQYDRDYPALIFHPASNGQALSNLELQSDISRITLVIGPESGFSEDEVERAVEAGLKPIHLGSRILRTETAGPVVAALVMSRLGELS
jgi:16S rRNA (uracil1498-N3)-methyltransferase